MLHPASELRYVSDVIGYGVFATRFIPKGTITWVFDPLDQVISLDKAERMDPVLREMLEKYSYVSGAGERILCWDHSRFVNHSCNATSLAPGLNLEIAIRDIYKGEEITDDYGALNIEAPFACRCGARQCRGTIGPTDFVLHSERWDRLLRAAFPLIERVEQPLWRLVEEKTQIEKILSGEEPLPSCRIHFWANGECATGSSKRMSLITSAPA
jgi:uncharacterized protein